MQFITHSDENSSTKTVPGLNCTFYTLAQLRFTITETAPKLSQSIMGNQMIILGWESKINLFIHHLSPL